MQRVSHLFLADYVTRSMVLHCIGSWQTTAESRCSSNTDTYMSLSTEFDHLSRLHSMDALSPDPYLGPLLIGTVVAAMSVLCMFV